MAAKKKRQTFGKLKREQAVRERRVRKQERKEAAREAKAAGGATVGEVLVDPDETVDDVPAD